MFMKNRNDWMIAAVIIIIWLLSFWASIITFIAYENKEVAISLYEITEGKNYVETNNCVKPLFNYWNIACNPAVVSYNCSSGNLDLIKCN